MEVGEFKELIFGLPPIAGLFPLLLYIALSFRKNVNPICCVAVSALVGAVMINYPLMQIGSVLAQSLQSFLVLIGLIIMCGSGLGNVLNKTGVSQNIVYIFVHKIGIDSENKAILTTMLVSVVLVTLLGTMAGANAIIAPIIIPLVAAVGITPNVLAVLFQGAGQTGLFLGPFSPPVVTLMKLTGLSYGDFLLYAGFPLVLCMWCVTFVAAKWIQKKTRGKYSFSKEDQSAACEFVLTPEIKRATLVFVTAMVVLLGYGIAMKQGAAYAVFTMITAALATGVAAKMSFGELTDTFLEGMQKLLWMFIMFLLFDPFLNFISQSGAFQAIFEGLKPLMHNGGIAGFAVLASIIGIFGISGAAVAQAMLMNTLFAAALQALNMDMRLWALILLIGSQITSFAYPGVDMLGEMGLARSRDIKAMLLNGYGIIAVALILVVAMALMY